MDPFSVIALAKVGYYLYKSDSLVDKVNHAVMQLTANKTRNVSREELKHALHKLKGRKSAADVHMRCMLLFILAAYERWDADPHGTESKLKQSKPMLSSWDSDPKIRKLEMVLCTYFRSHAEKKIKKKIESFATDEIKGQMEDAIGDVVEEVLQEIFGEMVTDALMALLF